jgi:hypothetical protein
MNPVPIAFTLAATLLLSATPAVSDPLQDYAGLCNDAIGVPVPDFDCDAGTEVPGQGTTFNAGSKCDQPNRLNRVCDPGSRFQVLTRTADVFTVAHCRKENGPAGDYGDIAVIQYSRKNGATCFYQALGNQHHGDLPGGSLAPGADAKPVKAPSKGSGAFPWLSPSGTAGIGCGGCHDNGPFIRSPYLNQLKGANALPGSDDFSFNSDQHYAFVGDAFKNWKAFSVTVGNECTSCHRLGVNNILAGQGTALDFGLRATAASEDSKIGPTLGTCGTTANPINTCPSPIWMPPVPMQVEFSTTHAAAAKAVHDCALRLGENPLPNAANCTIKLFAQAYSEPAPSGSEADIVTIIQLIQLPTR